MFKVKKKSPAVPKVPEIQQKVRATHKSYMLEIAVAGGCVGLPKPQTSGGDTVLILTPLGGPKAIPPSLVISASDPCAQRSRDRIAPSIETNRGVGIDDAADKAEKRLVLGARLASTQKVSNLDFNGRAARRHVSLV